MKKKGEKRNNLNMGGYPGESESVVAKGICEMAFFLMSDCGVGDI